MFKRLTFVSPVALLPALLSLCAAASAQGTLVVDNPAQRAGHDAATLRFDAFAANDHVALSNFTDDPWPGDYRTRPGRNLSLLSARAAAGASFGGFGIDYVRRADWLLQASGDTAHAFYFSQTDQLITSGRDLDLDYRLRGFEADGLRVSASGSFQLPWLGGSSRAGVAANLLRGLRLRAEDARAVYTSDGTSASLNGRRELWYSNLTPSGSSGISAFRPFSEEAVPANGSGRSLDVGVHHRFAGGTEVALAANDVAGRMRWRNMPHMTQDVAISNVTATSYTSDGTPAVSGYNNYLDFAEALPVKYLASARAPLAAHWSAFGELRRISGNDMPRLGLSWSPAPKREILFDYESRWKTFGLLANWESFTLGLRANAWPPLQGSALGISAAVACAF